MKPFEAVSLISLSFIFFFSHKASPNPTICKEAGCEPSGSVPVRFPFRLKNLQPPLCGFNRIQTGRFDLSCNNRSQTVIDLARPNSPAQNLFTVESIDYKEQFMWVNDPDNCLPRRFLNGDLDAAVDGGSFEVDPAVSFTFMACPPEIAAARRELILVPCLSGGDRVVVAAPTELVDRSLVRGSPEYSSPAPAPAVEGRRGGGGPARCSVIGVVLVPVPVYEYMGWPWMEVGPVRDLRGGVRLRWRLPNCRECERRGGVCGYRRGSGSDLGCSVSLQRSSRSGLPRSAKYGIIIAVGIPGLLCIIGLGCYVFGRLRPGRERHRQSYTGHGGPYTSEPTVVLMGLDGPTIESFPKIELGESKRLPKPNDNTCPICLSDYQPKDTLRTIPECNHYFHANCVDEWLKMNATCPLCRNSPDCSSRVTSSSPSVSSFSSSSLSSR